MNQIYVFDPTASDPQSSVRGVGRYLQILKENFPEFHFINFINFKNFNNSIFINPFFNFLQKPLTMKKIAKKQIAVIHDLIPLKYPEHFPSGIKGKINIFLNKLALKNYDLIITDSFASKKDIIQILHIDEKKIKVIYPCLPKIFSEKSQITNNKSQINSKYQISNFKHLKFENSDLFETWDFKLGAFCLYVGDATWNKNLVNLARAIKIANVTCVFAGKIFKNLKEIIKKQEERKKILNTKYLILNTYSHPWQKELKQFFQETKNDKRFIFAGFLPDKELIKLYQQATLNILASRDEGFGFSYLEAASQGCPTLLSDIPVLHEISDKNALFFNPENPNDIADKIGEIYFNQKIRNKLGQIAKKRSEFFSREKFKKEFEKILLE